MKVILFGRRDLLIGLVLLASATMISRAALAQTSSALAYQRSFPISGLNNIDADLVRTTTGSTYLKIQPMGPTDIDPGPAQVVVSSGAIIKYDDANNYLWHLPMGGSDNTVNIEMDTDDHLVVYGMLRDTVDVEPGAGVTLIEASSSALGQRAFVLRLAPNDQLDFAYVLEQQDGTSYVSISAVGTHPSNTAISISGFFKGAVDLDPGPGAQITMSNGGSQDVFLVSLDPQGGTNWIKTIGGGGNERSEATAIDAQGNILLGGYFSSSILDLDPNGGSTEVQLQGGGADAFLAKLDGVGNLLWGWGIGGSGVESFMGLRCDDQNRVHARGLLTINTLPLDVDPGSGVAQVFYSGGYQAGASFIVTYSPAGDYLHNVAFDGHRVSDYRLLGDELLVIGSVAYDPADPFTNTNTQFDFDMNSPASSTFGLYDGPGQFYTIAGFVGSYSADDGALNWVQNTGIYNYGFGQTINAMEFPHAFWVDADSTITLLSRFNGTADLDFGTGETLLTADSVTVQQNLVLSSYRPCLAAAMAVVFSSTTNVVLGASVDLSVTNAADLGDGTDWYWYTDSCGGTPLGSGAQITLTPTETGYYYVRAEGSCFGSGPCASVEITVATVLPELGSAAPLSLFPNPSERFFALDPGAHAGIMSLYVRDATGRTILTHEQHGSSLILVDLVNQPAGVYTFELTVGGHTFRTIGSKR